MTRRRAIEHIAPCPLANVDAAGETCRGTYCYAFTQIDPGGSEGEPVSGDTGSAYTFLRACGLDPTPDAVAQLTEAFLPCLRIMCERENSPDGTTWQESGWRGQLFQAMNEFDRLKERAWQRGRTDLAYDPGRDAINYLGFMLRSLTQNDNAGWGQRGKPGYPSETGPAEDPPFHYDGQYPPPRRGEDLDPEPRWTVGTIDREIGALRNINEKCIVCYVSPGFLCDRETHRRWWS